MRIRKINNLVEIMGLCPMSLQALKGLSVILWLILSVGIGTVSAGGPIWTANPDWDAPDDVGTGAAPAFVDLDGDGDYDLFIGEQFGVSFAYENTGSASSPIWTAKPDWNLPDVGMGSKPSFADLDNDGDYDLLIGEGPNATAFAFENTGNASSPNWTRKSSWEPPSLEWNGCKPALADLDNDGDYDLQLYAASIGNPSAYKNTGSTSSPIWTARPSWNPPDMGQGATPALADLDDDDDYDLLVGNKTSATSAYENTGSASSPIWTARPSWNPPDVAGQAAKPALADLDDDGDCDLLIGTMDGVSLGYENTAEISDTDTKPPVISNVFSTGITNNSATITWDTDESSDSLVKYGTTSEVYTSEEYNTAEVTSHNISLTGLDAGTNHYYLVSSTDSSGNAAESAEYSFTTQATPDTTPPIISNVTSTGITNNSATITWDTDESSDSLVKYGTTSEVYTSEEYNAAEVTSHNVSLTGLDAEATYYYLVSSTDSSGNAAESAEYSFTTLATPTMKKAFEIISIEAGKTKSVTFGGLDVRKISIEVDKNVSDVTVTVEEVNKPEEITEVPGIAYGYIKITVTNLMDVNVTTKIEFKVNKSWLAGHNIDEATIKLNRCDGNWTTLPTSKIDEDNVSVYFEAETTGFSLFAITGEKKEVVAVVAVTPTHTSAVIPATTPTTTPSTTPVSTVPGFEAIFATTSLLIAYLYLFVFRKKGKGGDR
jgi:PGF-pre-PGF domain-containing protein